MLENKFSIYKYLDEMLLLIPSNNQNSGDGDDVVMTSVGKLFISTQRDRNIMIDLIRDISNEQAEKGLEIKKLHIIKQIFICITTFTKRRKKLTNR